MVPTRRIKRSMDEDEVAHSLRHRKRCRKLSETSESDYDDIGQRRSLRRAATRRPSADDTSSNDRDPVRRSTRQKKLVYDTLNQSWLLSLNSHGPLIALPADKHGSRGDVYEDMYSRIKRKRQEDYIKRRGKSRGSSHDEDDDDIEEEEDDTRGRDGEAEEEEEKKPQIQQQDIPRPKKPKEVVVEEEELSGQSSEAESSEESSLSSSSTRPKYHLRKRVPFLNRYQVPIAEAVRPPLRRSARNFYPSSSQERLHHRSGPKFTPCLSPKISHRKRATHHHNSSSDTSSESEDENKFQRRKCKSMAKVRSQCLPMNLTARDVLSGGILRDRRTIGSSMADVDPMNIDRTASFESIGGLTKQIRSLKEMVLFPLMYPEFFEKYKISPPRGVLFYGPPGTGKTLVARALANECSQKDRQVAFFMRKGADCLSKWVGESERQLRLLFDQAYSMRPSIIFFDEIDGLAPVRSSRQDQIHSSIVSTLLALMDGLDSRGEVIVIGATNRLDAIDPALRRPGRFDREFHFPLPSVEARDAILKIHTQSWKPALSNEFVRLVAEQTVGYCGADLKALCAETAILALKRRYPQIYMSKEKLLLDVSTIQIESQDFVLAKSSLVAASHRCAATCVRALPPFVRPLLTRQLQRLITALKRVFPLGFTALDTVSAADQEDVRPEATVDIYNRDGMTPPAQLSTVFSSLQSSSLVSCRPRLLMCGHSDQGHASYLCPALLHHLEHIPTFKVDLPALYGVSAKSPEESCAQLFGEARRHLPSILYLPHIEQSWSAFSDTLRATFLSLVRDLDSSMPLCLLATSDRPYAQLPKELASVFRDVHDEVAEVKNPKTEERLNFFTNLILEETIRLPPTAKKPGHVDDLPKAPPPPPRVLSEAELVRLEAFEEETLCELRQFLRDVLYKLARDRRYAFFTKPVDVEEVPDYYDIVKEPMDIETMMCKIDGHKYTTIDQFLADFDLICNNALQYNPENSPSGQMIRHRACSLRDAAYALVRTQLNLEFEQRCNEIEKAREQRGQSSKRNAPPQVRLPTCPPPLTKTDGKTPTSSPESKETKRSSFRLPTTGKKRIMYRRKQSIWFGGRTRCYFHKRTKEEVTTRDVSDTEDYTPTDTQERAHEDYASDRGDSESPEFVTDFSEGRNEKSLQPESNNKEDSNPNLPEENISGSNVVESDAPSDADSAAVNLPTKVVVSRSALQRFLNQLVAVTTGFTVSNLEMLYSRLAGRVRRYQAVWDRSELVKDLEDELEKFQPSVK